MNYINSIGNRNIFPSLTARYYNSALSIWLSVDPMLDKYPNLSPYTYCADNPVRLVDEEGKEIVETFLNPIISQNMTKNINISNYGMNFKLTGDEPPLWVRTKNTFSTVKTSIVNGLEAADKFCQSDIVGRVAGAISQINPLVSLTNAAVTIGSDHDMFGKPVTTSDKIISGISAGFK